MKQTVQKLQRVATYLTNLIIEDVDV